MKINNVTVDFYSTFLYENFKRGKSETNIVNNRLIRVFDTNCG